MRRALEATLIFLAGALSAFFSAYPPFWNVYVAKLESSPLFIGPGETFSSVVARYFSFSPLFESLANDMESFLPGLVFGCVFVLISRLYKRTRMTIGKVLLIIVGSSFAYLLASIAATVLGIGTILPVAFFTAGVIGALLFLLSIWRLVPLRRSAIVQLVLWGGILGTISEPIFFHFVKWRDGASFFGDTPDLAVSFDSLFYLFLIWQIGMLLLIYIYRCRQVELDGGKNN